MTTTPLFAPDKRYNPYLDLNYVDRSEEIDNLFDKTLDDIQRDPEFYAELVNDLMFHWVYGTRETKIMNMVKDILLTKK
jgi:hypothetical protein